MNDLSGMSDEQLQALIDAPQQAAAPTPAPASSPSSGGSLSGMSDEDLQKIAGGEPQKPAVTWGQVPIEAVKNIPSSALEFGKNIVQPIVDPIGTAKSIGGIGAGVMQKLGIMSGTENIADADAVGKFLVDRYGSLDAIKNTLATDPVGLASDISMLLSGGAMTAARVPAIAGVAARAGAAPTAAMLRTAARLTDPLTPVAKGVGLVGSGIGRLGAEIIGTTTHTGSEPYIQAARAGREGGRAAEAFTENMRGAVPETEAVEGVKKAVSGLTLERGQEYVKGMKEVAKDTTPLPFTNIDKALQDITGVQTYGAAQVPLNVKTAGVRNRINDIVDAWRMLDPAEYHTPAGLDALKRKLDQDVLQTTKAGTSQRFIAQQAVNAVRKTIVDQVPEYAKVMRGYEDASRELATLRHEFSLPLDQRKQGTIGTSLRKLQSVVRNNVNTSFGNRQRLAEFLVENGAPDLMYQMAGQAVQTWTPRGLGKLAASLVGELGLLGGVGAATSIPHVVAGLAAMSPRLMGEAAYGVGAGMRQLERLPQGMGRPTQAIGRAATEPLRITVNPAFDAQPSNDRSQAAWEAFRSGNFKSDQVLDAARAAIASGKSRSAVERLLHQNGINPSLLTQPQVPMSQ